MKNPVMSPERPVNSKISAVPKRQKKVEVLFAHLKRIMNFDRLRLRGITRAHDEFFMAATVQNLKKLAEQRYKPPDHRIGVPV